MNDANEQLDWALELRDRGIPVDLYADGYADGLSDGKAEVMEWLRINHILRPEKVDDAGTT